MAGSLDGIEVYDLVSDEGLSAEAEQTVCIRRSSSSRETIRDVMRLVNDLKPKRVVFDSLSEMRLLAQSALRYTAPDPRAQAILRAARLHGADARRPLLGGDGDLHLHSIAHGVLHLSRTPTTMAPTSGGCAW